MTNIPYPVPKQEYKVMVQCCTYNQSQYIEDTLKGFAIQQTDFPFVCCVFDDASTDGEQEVLKRWIDNHCNPNDVEVYDHPLAIILIASEKSNPYCIYAMHLQKVNTWGKPEKQEMISHWEKRCEYIAICEGDDYWIDPLKLQKQYDLLESDTTISLCHHDFYVMIDGELNRRKINIPNRQDIYSVARYNYPQTLSMFYRNIREPLIPEEFMKNRKVYQFFWNIRLAEYGDVYYLNEPMGVYRQQAGSVFFSKNRYEQFKMAISNIDNMIDWFTNWHPNKKVVRQLKARGREESFMSLLAQTRRFCLRKSLCTFFKLIKYL
ncbi:MAG: hypothetical protein SPF00_05440 [Candidatus Egerieousia sp.]|nr:hypothetical protein [Candidatus Egerieousia sp.]